jgi:hypothetical protein
MARTTHGLNATQSRRFLPQRLLPRSVGPAALGSFVIVQLMGCGVDSKLPADNASPKQPNAPGTIASASRESSAEAPASAWQGLAARWQGDITIRGTKFRVERDACLHIAYVASTSKPSMQEARGVDLERNGTVVALQNGDALTCFRHDETFILRGKDGNVRVTVHGDSRISTLP